MIITIFGAAGEVGSRIVNEALQRNHKVNAVVRSVKSNKKIPNDARIIIADLNHSEDIINKIEGSDLIISAVKPPEGQENQLVSLTKSVLSLSVLLGTRAIIVGGAARLRINDNSSETVLTAEGFLPDEIIPIAKACQAQYELCTEYDTTICTYVSPPAILTRGERTENFRIGSDTLIFNDEGKSIISMEDFAVAILNEAEEKSFLNNSFTVGY